jgi:hypothetical protein
VDLWGGDTLADDMAGWNRITIPFDVVTRSDEWWLHPASVAIRHRLPCKHGCIVRNLPVALGSLYISQRRPLAASRIASADRSDLLKHNSGTRVRANELAGGKWPRRGDESAIVLQAVTLESWWAYHECRVGGLAAAFARRASSSPSGRPTGRAR